MENLYEVTFLIPLVNKLVDYLISNTIPGSLRETIVAALSNFINVREPVGNPK